MPNAKHVDNIKTARSTPNPASENSSQDRQQSSVVQNQNKGQYLMLTHSTTSLPNPLRLVWILLSSYKHGCCGCKRVWLAFERGCVVIRGIFSCRLHWRHSYPKNTVSLIVAVRRPSFRGLPRLEKYLGDSTSHIAARRRQTKSRIGSTRDNAPVLATSATTHVPLVKGKPWCNLL